MSSHHLTHTRVTGVRARRAKPTSYHAIWKHEPCRTARDRRFQDSRGQHRFRCHHVVQPCSAHGTIDKILKFCDISDSRPRDRHLRRYLKEGQEEVRQCVSAITVVQEKFGAWSTVTRALLDALTKLRGAMSKQAVDLEKQGGRVREKKTTQESEIQAELTRLGELRNRLQNFQKMQDTVTGTTGRVLVETITAGTTISIATLGTIPFTTLLGIGGVVVGGGFLYWQELKRRVTLLEDQRSRQELDIGGLDRQTVALGEALAAVEEMQNGVQRLIDKVHQQIDKISKLQRKIEAFMTHIKTMARIVIGSEKSSKLVFETADDTDGLLDPDIKQDLLDRADEMRARFDFLARASDTFTAISTQFNIPSIDQLENLGVQVLHGDSRDSDVGAQQAQLEKLREEATKGAKRLASKMQDAIKRDLNRLEEVVGGDSDISA
ncbi:hypothetical protein QBC35DRAFT_500412 [Podospora australis]|uniref:Uncharacterized protein n=1 Tax=Podospora australis TaxID=1536484 RepID=A0AAN6WRC4_9PEZI|nr:hypothetical protein QBC35DRAFT_500412 [Podospora australis]